MVRVQDTASMRPPEFTGGNLDWQQNLTIFPCTSFNEAAGIHRRKPPAPL